MEQLSERPDQPSKTLIMGQAALNALRASDPEMAESFQQAVLQVWIDKCAQGTTLGEKVRFLRDNENRPHIALLKAQFVQALGYWLMTSPFQNDTEIVRLLALDREELADVFFLCRQPPVEHASAEEERAYLSERNSVRARCSPQMVEAMRRFINAGLHALLREDVSEQKRVLTEVLQASQSAATSINQGLYKLETARRRTASRAAGESMPRIHKELRYLHGLGAVRPGRIPVYPDCMAADQYARRDAFGTSSVLRTGAILTGMESFGDVERFAGFAVVYRMRKLTAALVRFHTEFLTPALLDKFPRGRKVEKVKLRGQIPFVECLQVFEDRTPPAAAAEDICLNIFMALTNPARQRIVKAGDPRAEELGTGDCRSNEPQEDFVQSSARALLEMRMQENLPVLRLLRINEFSDFLQSMIDFARERHADFLAAARGIYLYSSIAAFDVKDNPDEKTHAIEWLKAAGADSVVIRLLEKARFLHAERDKHSGEYTLLLSGPVQFQRLAQKGVSSWRNGILRVKFQEKQEGRNEAMTIELYGEEKLEISRAESQPVESRINITPHAVLRIQKTGKNRTLQSEGEPDIVRSLEAFVRRRMDECEAWEALKSVTGAEVSDQMKEIFIRHAAAALADLIARADMILGRDSGRREVGNKPEKLIAEFAPQAPMAELYDGTPAQVNARLKTAGRQLPMEASPVIVESSEVFAKCGAALLILISRGKTKSAADTRRFIERENPIYRRTRPFYANMPHAATSGSPLRESYAYMLADPDAYMYERLLKYLENPPMPAVIADEIQMLEIRDLDALNAEILPEYYMCLAVNSDVSSMSGVIVFLQRLNAHKNTLARALNSSQKAVFCQELREKIMPVFEKEANTLANTLMQSPIGKHDQFKDFVRIYRYAQELGVKLSPEIFAAVRQIFYKLYKTLGLADRCGILWGRYESGVHSEITEIQAAGAPQSVLGRTELNSWKHQLVLLKHIAGIHHGAQTVAEELYRDPQAIEKLVSGMMNNNILPQYLLMLTQGDPCMFERSTLIREYWIDWFRRQMLDESALAVPSFVLEPGATMAAKKNAFSRSVLYVCAHLFGVVDYVLREEFQAPQESPIPAWKEQFAKEAIARAQVLKPRLVRFIRAYSEMLVSRNRE